MTSALVTGTDAASRSARLNQSLGAVIPGVEAAIRRFESAQPFRAAYTRFLLALHGTMRASVPLMETAREEFRGISSASAAALDAYLRMHCEEERGHDEWVLHDLSVLGFSRQTALATSPLPAVAALVGPMYYWINHVDPVTELGYIYYLERFPVTHGSIDRWKRLGDIPEDALTNLRRHADLDLAHGDDVAAFVDGLDLTSAQEELLSLAAIHTAVGVARLLDQVATGLVV